MNQFFLHTLPKYMQMYMFQKYNNKYQYIYLFMSMYIHTMRVCVNHLKRCKTSTSDFTCSFFILLLAREKMLNFPDFCRQYFISFQAGGMQAHCGYAVPTKLFHNGGSRRLITLRVPALSFPIYQSMATWLSQEPARRTIGFCFYCFKPNANSQLSQSMSTSLPVRSSQSGHGDDSFSNVSRVIVTIPIPVRYNWSVFARKIHSTSKFAMIVLSKCVIHAGFVKVA